MSIITRDTPRMHFSIDLDNKEIKVTQRWKYTWINGESIRQTLQEGQIEDRGGLLGTPMFHPMLWDFFQRQNFMRWAEFLIRYNWSNRVTIEALRNSGLPEDRRRFTLVFDIENVASDWHWEVEVRKQREYSWSRSEVKWVERKIELYADDLYPNSITLRTTVAHEFGHAFGRTNLDEYYNDHPHAGDVRSIMHSGNELRRRHFRWLLWKIKRIMQRSGYPRFRCRVVNIGLGNSQPASSEFFGV